MSQENSTDNSVQTQLSLGERRVRTNFNASGESSVDRFKAEAANTINILESLRSTDGSLMNSEKARLISLAQTAYEEACMWAVKAATF